jgi:cellobiose epimerase
MFVPMLVRVLIFAALSSSVMAAPPERQELQQQAARCRALLKSSLIDFYLPHCLDRENGGYLESLRDNKFAGTGEKFLTLQARQLWFFSTLAIHGFERDQALAAAKHGYDFLQNKMRDPVHGGYFSKVTDAGEPKDPRKHAYLNSFALYGLVAYSRASGDQQALQAAKSLFEVLDAKAHDSQFGGYIEFFERDWTEVTNTTASGYVGAIGQKTYNTHLHLLESFAELARAWTNERLQQRLNELLAINVSTVHYPTENNNVDAFLRNWSIVQTPRNLRASYGHDVECVWLVMDAARTAGHSPSTLLNWATGLADNCLRLGYDREHGGFYNSGPLDQPADDTKKIWWVQNEALLGMLEMYRLTRDEKYYRAFVQTLDFSEKFQIAREGGWWATRAADGSPTNDRQRSSPWQGAYHAGRALIYAANWLDELAKSN